MAKCRTKSHGEIEYSEDAVMHFSEGLFGFESETRFLPIEVPALHPILSCRASSVPGFASSPCPFW